MRAIDLSSEVAVGGTSVRAKAIAFAVALVALCVSAHPALAQSAGARSFAFRGKVISVNAAARTLEIANENVQGWMGPMTMPGYKVDQPDVFKVIKAGDFITAVVYAGDMTLHNVKVVSPPATAAGDLPPVSYVCPTPAEASYVDDRPGKCPISGETLVATRLVTAYSCLKNQVVIREAPGICPTDRSELVPITVAMHFTCKGDPAVREMNPGSCADGSPRIKAFERRPHGDHNPRHGGDFVFMAVDQWHHLEGTYVRPGIFRVYLYDDMMRPLAVAALSGRVAIADSNARETGPSFPLVPGDAADHNTLEAKVPSAGFPASMKVFMKFKPADKEQIFDFTFKDYSKAP